MTQESSRILYVHRGESVIRGSERVLIDLLEGLDGSLFSPVVWCNQNTLAEELECLVESRIVSSNELLFEPRFKFGSARAILSQMVQLVRIVRREDVRLIHCNNIESLQWIIPAARFTKTPVIAHMHQLHNAWRRCAYLLYSADFVVGCSKAVVHDLIEDGYPADRTRVIYNAVKVRPEGLPVLRHIRSELGIDPSAVVLAVVGAVVQSKGFDVAIDGLLRLRQRNILAHLLILGDGDAKSELLRQVAKHQLEGFVHFLGFVSRDEVLSILANDVDVTLVPSRYESLSLVSLEAQSVGVPVVVAGVGGMPETVSVGKSGFTFPVDDSASLANAVLKLIDMGAAKRALKADCMQWIGARFNMDRMIREFSETYDAVLRMGTDSRWQQRRHGIAIKVLAREAVATLR